MDLKNYITGIRKTGFPLEFAISEILRKHSWVVTNNKYYIDDRTNTVREIDIVANRIRKVQWCFVFTTLIISCKKDENNVWAFLSKVHRKKHPISNLYPIHIWTNDKRMKFAISEPSWKSSYFNHLSMSKKSKATKAVFGLGRDIFAFQQMNSKSGAPQNDKHIFTCVESLMKAQAHELKSLSKREQTPCFHQFNLISVVDAPLVDLHFKGIIDGSGDGECDIEATEIELADNVVSYIIDDQDTDARIRFIRKDTFEAYLEEYDELHDANAEYCDKEIDAFYKDAVNDPSKVKLLHDEFIKNLGFQIRRKLGEGPIRIFCFSGEKVKIETGLSEAEAEELHKINMVTSTVANALRIVFRYDGPFEFVHKDWVPF